MLAMSINSSLPTPRVLEILEKSPFLLSNAIARSRRFGGVRILSMDSARRLRDLITSKIQVRFEAEPGNSHRVSNKNISIDMALQVSFQEAGLDFKVNSAKVTITSMEVPASESKDTEEDSNVLVVVCGAVALFMLSSSGLV